jgi:uncharacterized RDD family membrane protein YckC
VSVARQGDTQHAQLAAIRRLRGPAVPVADAVSSDGGYAGLITRTVAFSIDALIVNGAAALVGVTVGLGLSILHLPSEADAVIAAVLGGLWIVWTVGYFAFFWSSTGQTPGDRVMRIVVRDVHERGPLKPRRAILRFVAVCLGAIPLLAGLLMMLWDERRRCFHDRTARTVVVYGPGEP